MAWIFGGAYQDKEEEKIDNFIKKKFANIEFPADNIINCFIDPETLQFKQYASSI
jgi:hypothetical protein